MSISAWPVGLILFWLGTILVAHAMSTDLGVTRCDWFYSGHSGSQQQCHPLWAQRPLNRDVGRPQRAVFSHRADDGIQLDPYFGLKYIGVDRGGTLELHGQKKLSWTFLNKTLHPGGLEEGGYFFERSWGHRGVIVHVIDPKSGTVIHSDR